MSLFGRGKPSPAMLVAATHEIGHLMWARHVGVRVTLITFDQRRRSGTTLLDLPEDFGETMSRSRLGEVLIGDVAGLAAETVWHGIYGGRVDKSGSLPDLQHFAEYARRARVRKGEALEQATALLVRRWNEVETLAHDLAVVGRLTPDRKWTHS